MLQLIDAKMPQMLLKLNNAYTGLDVLAWNKHTNTFKSIASLQIEFKDDV